MSTSLRTPTDRGIRGQGRTASGARPGLALTAIVATQLMFLVDATVVNVALPDIALDLHFSPTRMSWILNLYTLAFGGLLLLGSRIGDRIGRRRALVTGVLAFTAASVLAGVAPSGGWLLLARTVQGVAAALAAPSTLALIATTFPEGRQRARALAVFASISGAGSALGLVLGGALTDLVSWHWVFLINLPVGLAIAWLAPRHLDETPRQRGPFDALGALLATLGMTSLVYAFIRTAERGWSDGLALGAFAAAAALLGSFLAVELRVRRPLVVLRLFADRNRSVSYATMLMIPAGMFGVFYFTTQYLQRYLEYSPFRAGLAFLALAVPLFAASRFAPRAQARFGPKRTALAGLTLNTAGTLWLTRLDASSGYADGLLGPLVLMGVGVGLTMMQLTTLILSGVEPEDAGSASGLLQTMQYVGGSLGLSVLVSVFDVGLRHSSGHTFFDGTGAAFTAAAAFSALALLLMAGARNVPRTS